jgi:hypothetical protein
MLAFVNKGKDAIHLTLPERFAAADRLRRWELRGPSLTAKDGVQFGLVPLKQHTAAIEIAGYSAATFQAG